MKFDDDDDDGGGGGDDDHAFINGCSSGNNDGDHNTVVVTGVCGEGVMMQMMKLMKAVQILSYSVGTKLKSPHHTITITQSHPTIPPYYITPYHKHTTIKSPGQRNLELFYGEQSKQEQEWMYDSFT